jgi:hypothetical protein
MVTNISFIISLPHTVPLKTFSSPLFLNHTLIFNWIAASSFTPTNQIHHIPLIAYCLAYTGLPKTPNQYILTLKMATTMSAKQLDNVQHSLQLTPTCQSFTVNKRAKT